MKTLDLIVNIIVAIIFIGLVVGIFALLFAMAKKSFISFLICGVLTTLASFQLVKAMP